MNVARLLARSARIWPDATALALGVEPRASYSRLAADVAARAGSMLGQLGLKRGDRVAVFMKNRPEYLQALFATWHAGLAAVPVNAKLHPRELAHILQDSDARLCLVSPELGDAVAPLADSVPSLERVISTDEDEWRSLAGGNPVEVADTSADELAWLFYTSGTTGLPKGAMLSHANLMSMSLGYLADVDTIHPGDAILHAAPLSHGSGLYSLAHVARAAVNVIPCSGQFDPQEILSLLAAWPQCAMFFAPTMVKRLVEHPAIRDADTSNLKTIVYGGGPMYVADLKRAMNALGNKLAQIYGQGESPMTITVSPKSVHGYADHPRYEQRLASVGTAFSHIEVRVVDDADHPLSAGETGEICVRGDTVMKGYWNRPEATAETLRGGWLHTGDVGALDEDGFLTLKDRSKDVIISGGTNIYPREVEEVLLRHPAVAEASVVGRPHPEWGEEVIAFVVPAGSGALPEQELDALCLDTIARFKRPRAYRVLESLPKNNYGKVLKTELRKLLAQRDDSAQLPGE